MGTRKTKDDTEAKVLVLVRDSVADKVYIMAGDDGKITGFKDEKDAKRTFSRTYNEAHGRSYTWSMSACIHFIQYQPRVVRFKDLDDIKSRIASDPPRLVSLWGVAGGMNAVTCRDEAKAIWEAAESVPLITRQRRAS